MFSYFNKFGSTIVCPNLIEERKNELEYLQRAAGLGSLVVLDVLGLEAPVVASWSPAEHQLVLLAVLLLHVAPDVLLEDCDVTHRTLEFKTYQSRKQYFG